MQRPTNKTNKAEIIAYLESHQIEHDPTASNAVLLALVPEDPGSEEKGPEPPAEVTPEEVTPEEETPEAKATREAAEAAEAQAKAEKEAAEAAEAKKEGKDKAKAEKTANLEGFKKQITKAEKAHAAALKAEQEAKAEMNEASERYMKARKTAEIAASALSAAQSNRVFDEKDLEVMSKDYFERFPKVNLFFASDDGTFFFNQKDLKGAKGQGATAYTFNRS